MRVFNITDVETQPLRAQSLVGQHIRIGEAVIRSGGYADIRGTAKESSELRVYLKVGAVSIDELPTDYAAKKGLQINGTPLPKKEEVQDLPEPSSDQPAEDSDWEAPKSE